MYASFNRCYRIISWGSYCTACGYHSRLQMPLDNDHSRIMPMPAVKASTKSPPAQRWRLASLGDSFAVFPTPLAPAVQIVSPQRYPEGQHPPLTEAGQENMPLLQVEAPRTLVGPLSTIVTPEPVVIVVPVGGQCVVSQFRPTLQHPPARCAEHM